MGASARDAHVISPRSHTTRSGFDCRRAPLAPLSTRRVARLVYMSARGVSCCLPHKRTARKLVLHVIAEMKTNITLKLDADLLREARILAAEEGSSISRLLAARLEEIVGERKGYASARRRALARLREGLDLRWTPPRSRDELHER
jgi:hypothetical protein